MGPCCLATSRLHRSAAHAIPRNISAPCLHNSSTPVVRARPSAEQQLQQEARHALRSHTTALCGRRADRTPVSPAKMPSNAPQKRGVSSNGAGDRHLHACIRACKVEKSAQSEPDARSSVEGAPCELGRRHKQSQGSRQQPLQGCGDARGVKTCMLEFADPPARLRRSGADPPPRAS